MNAQLKLLVLERFGSQFAFCRQVGMREARLSDIIRGRAHPRPEERKRIAAALGEPEGRLFGRADAGPRRTGGRGSNAGNAR